MDKSILNDIKKLLGLSEDCKDFDTDIILHINTVFMILGQLGVGNNKKFSISDDKAKWSDYLTEEDDLEAVKTYIHLKVKLIFDPPLNAAIVAAIQETINELEWRLNVQVDTEGKEED